jgi:hypothetical protein
VEVEVGRAARAAADDKAAAEQRIAARRQRRRRGVFAVLLLPLLVIGGAFLADRVWFGPPSLAIGTNHAVTLQASPAYAKCPHAWEYTYFKYGDVWWSPSVNRLPASWGTKGPWRGVLTITGPVSRSTKLTYGPRHPNGTFSYAGTAIPVYGGPPWQDAGLMC